MRPRSRGESVPEAPTDIFLKCPGFSDTNRTVTARKNAAGFFDLQPPLAPIALDEGGGVKPVALVADSIPGQATCHRAIHGVLLNFQVS